jgi:hypothetical protein
MAVQPDKRPWAELMVANGWDETERYRVGIWALKAPRVDHTPSAFRLRCDRPGFPKGTHVTWEPHHGWVIYDGDDKHSSRVSPLDCLEWWVARRG